MNEEYGVGQANAKQPEPVVEPEDRVAQEIEEGRRANEKAANDTTNALRPSLFQRFMHRHFPDAKAHDRWTLVFTAVIAISTFLYTIFAGWTLLEIRSGGVDTHNLAVAAIKQAHQGEIIAQAAQDQSSAADNIVDAADNFSDSADEINTHSAESVEAFQRLAGGTEKAVTVAESRARVEDRPYAAFLPRYAGLIANPKGGDQVLSPIMPLGVNNFQIAIAVDMKIKGRTPAVEMEFSPTTIIVGSSEEADKKALGYVPTYIKPQGEAMLPEDTVTVGSNLEPVVTKAQWDDITEGTWSVYVVGAVRYRDVFKPTLGHKYEAIYCFKLRSSGMPFGTCRNNKSTDQQ